MAHANRTGRQVQDNSILIAKFCSQLLSYRSSGTLHLFSSQDTILSLLPHFSAPFCAAQFSLHFTLPALILYLYLSSLSSVNSQANKVRVELAQFIASRANI